MTSQVGKPAAADYPRYNGDGPSVSKTTSPKTLTDRLQRDFEHQHAARTDTALPILSRQGQNLPAYTSVPYTDYDDDEPMPLPSAFRAAPAKSRSWLAQQVKAGLLGLVLGLALVLPTVLWLTGRFGETPALSRLQPSAVRDADAVVSRQPEPVVRAVASVDPLTASPQPVVRPSPEKRREDEADDLLKRAQEMIGDGNMVRAREILGDGLLADTPRGFFALAETYDPNILAATGARDVRAEVERARMLYAKALAGGVTAAENRLEALK